MRHYWGQARSKIDNMSLRERALIFAAAAFVLITLLNATLLDPLLARQKTLSSQVVQQQEKMKALQAQMQGLLQAREDDQKSPLRMHIASLKAQLQEQESYLKSRGDRMVEPGKMAGLLEQVLNKNSKLELVALETLPASLLIKPKAGNEQGGISGSPQNAATAQPAAATAVGQQRIFKHGVKITVRGAYPGLSQYLAELEKLPVQMFWGEAGLSVEDKYYPAATLTLTLYTLSLDKTWLTI